MKKVLIALDYSPGAQKVAETGYAYARSMDAGISIIHVVPDITYYSLQYSPIMGFEGFPPDGCYRDIDEQKNEARNFLKAVVKHLGEDYIETDVLEGKTAEAILMHAVKWGASLIIIGAQSHNGFEKLSVGDIAASILSYAAIPILIVPAGKADLNEIATGRNLYLQV